MKHIPVRHLLIYDDENNIYLDINQRRKWYTLIWGKVQDKNNPNENPMDWLRREVKEETQGIIDISTLSITKILADTLEEDWICWDGETYAAKISKTAAQKLQKVEQIACIDLNELKTLEQKYFWIEKNRIINIIEKVFSKK